MEGWRKGTGGEESDSQYEKLTPSLAGSLESRMTAVPSTVLTFSLLKHEEHGNSAGTQNLFALEMKKHEKFSIKHIQTLWFLHIYEPAEH